MLFNIGPLEFILILLVAIIVLGPERMVTGARSFGRWIYKLVRSPTWRAIITTSQEIRDLPNKIVRESGLEESLKEVQSAGAELNDEINQAVKDVNDEVSQAAIAVSAEVGQAVKDVNEELKQSTQEASQAAVTAVAEANQTIQAAEPLPGKQSLTEPVSLEIEGEIPVSPILAAETAESKTDCEPAPLPEILPFEKTPVEVAPPPKVRKTRKTVTAPMPVEPAPLPEILPFEKTPVEVAPPPKVRKTRKTVTAPMPVEPAPLPEILPIDKKPVEVAPPPKVRKTRSTVRAPKPVEAALPQEEPAIQPPKSPSANIHIE